MDAYHSEHTARKFNTHLVLQCQILTEKERDRGHIQAIMTRCQQNR